MKKVMQDTAERLQNLIRFEGANVLGDPSRLLKILQIGMGLYMVFFYFSVKENPPELIFSTLLLIGAAFLPSFLWCSGRVQGLPILPIIALKYIPSYVYPVQIGSRVLEGYSPLDQTEAVLSTAFYLFIVTMVWQQITKSTGRPSPIWYSIELGKATGWMLSVVGVYFLFQLVGGRLPMGLCTLIRGVLGNGTSLACFVLGFQLGQGKLSSIQKGLFLSLMGGSIAIEAGSLILASSIVKGSVILAGFTLGRQKLPWKFSLLMVCLLWVLHAGKSKMREEYWDEGVMGTTRVGVMQYPSLFANWLETGWQETFKAKTAYDDQGETASERGSLLNVYLKIMTQSPSRVPYLEGLTYRGIPRLLVPRFLNKDKGMSHEGNVWLAYIYKFVAEEGLMRVSIQFDLMMEAYANFGYWGMGVLAIALGTAIGYTTRLSTGVPVMSFRFLFATLFLTSYLNSNNTLAVFVTTLWQGFIGLCGLSFIMMKQMPNPFFVLDKVKWEKKGKGVSGNIEEGRRESEQVVGDIDQAAGCGLQAVKNEGGKTIEPENPMRHDRPTRFVYGKKKAD